MIRLRIVAAATAAVVAALAAPGTALGGPHSGARLTNPGFEIGGTAAEPAGWTEQGRRSASFTETGGHTGTLRLTHWSAEAYRVVTAQRLHDLPEGTYTLRAWVRSSGDQHSAQLTLTGCGEGPRRVSLPRTGPEWWVQIAVSTRVDGGGACTIAVESDAHAGDWINVDDLEFTRTPKPVGQVEIQGADVSQLAKNETYGASYRDARGIPRDALQILKSNGVNYLRLKVWVDSADDFHELDDILTMAGAPKPWDSRCWCASTTPTRGPTRASSSSPRRGPRSPSTSSSRRSTTTPSASWRR